MDVRPEKDAVDGLLKAEEARVCMLATSAGRGSPAGYVPPGQDRVVTEAAPLVLLESNSTTISIHCWNPPRVSAEGLVNPACARAANARGLPLWKKHASGFFGCQVARGLPPAPW